MRCNFNIMQTKLNKESVLDTLQKLPQEFTLDELIERLIVVEKISQGLEDVKAGNVVSHDEVKNTVRSWRK